MLLRLAAAALALVLGARLEVVRADAVLPALLPRAAVRVAVGVRVDAVLGVRRAYKLQSYKLQVTKLVSKLEVNV